eukprot:PhM_4_TR478/c2_g1_i1/m.27583
MRDEFEKSQTLESCRSRFQATAKAKALTPRVLILYGDEHCHPDFHRPEDAAGEGFLEQYGASKGPTSLVREAKLEQCHERRLPCPQWVPTTRRPRSTRP